MNEVTKWEDLSFIISSEYRKKILSGLENKSTPSVISKSTGINKTHVSRALKELESKGMIKCLTPNAKKGKIYLISDYGKEMLKEADKL